MTEKWIHLMILNSKFLLAPFQVSVRHNTTNSWQPSLPSNGAQSRSPPIVIWRLLHPPTVSSVQRSSSLIRLMGPSHAPHTNNIWKSSHSISTFNVRAVRTVSEHVVFQLIQRSQSFWRSFVYWNKLKRQSMKQEIISNSNNTWLTAIQYELILNLPFKFGSRDITPVLPWLFLFIKYINLTKMYFSENCWDYSWPVLVGCTCWLLPRRAWPYLLPEDWLPTALLSSGWFITTNLDTLHWPGAPLTKNTAFQISIKLNRPVEDGGRMRVWALVKMFSCLGKIDGFLLSYHMKLEICVAIIDGFLYFLSF